MPAGTAPHRSSREPHRGERENNLHETEIALRHMAESAAGHRVEHAAELRDPNVYVNVHEALEAGGEKAHYDLIESRFETRIENLYDRPQDAFSGGSNNSNTLVNPVGERAEARLSSFESNRKASDLVTFHEEESPNLRKRNRGRMLLLVLGVVGAPANVVILVGGVIASLFAAGIIEAGDDNEGGGNSNTPPQKPGKPTVTPQGKNAMQIAWTKVAGATKYTILRGGVEVGSVDGSAGSTFTDTGLQAGTTFCYAIIAVNALGNSDTSEEACATTPVAPPAAPATPKNLAAAAVSGTAINVTWSASEGATSYILKRRKAADLTDSEVIATLKVGTDANPLAFSDTGLEGNTQYAYVIAAANDAGTSADSAFIVGNTFDPCRVIADKIVEAWNALSEVDFWTSTIDWVKTDDPSLPCQFRVITFAFQIATKPVAFLLDTPEKNEAQANALVDLYNAQGTFKLYEAVAVLSVGGTELSRAEKLKVLSLVISKLLDAPE